MKDLIFSKNRILLLGSGELGKELVIESKRLGLEVMQLIDMKKHLQCKSLIIQK